MARMTGDRMVHLADFSPERREEVADFLDQLARGDTVTLGDFGDNAESTEADEHAAIIYELAATLRRAS